MSVEFGELSVTKAKLALQSQLDVYKDDLIKTLQELLVSKETLIAEMRERNNE